MAGEKFEIREVESRIRQIRGVSVMIDADLAEIYEVTTSALLQAVKRNQERFPVDFCFRVPKHEVANLRSQSVISSSASNYGGRRYDRWAFTEQGVAMLSSVLRSKKAVAVNIEIMRAFVRLRRASVMSGQVLTLVDDLSKRVDAHDAAISDIVDAIRRIVASPTKEGRPIGFTADIE